MSLAKLTREKHDEFFKLTHTAGALDQKTKQLIHTAVVLALRCEPWVEANLAVARKMGITEEELAETIQLAASVGSGSFTAMAVRASVKSTPQTGGNTLKDYLYFSR